MNVRRVRAVARKELLHILRDPRSLGIGIAMPILLLLLFGYALTLDVDDVPFAVWDQSRTPASRELISRFEASRYFSLVSYTTTYREIESAIDRRDILVALVIPLDYGSRKNVRVQLIVDGSDANTAAIAVNYAEAILGNTVNAVMHPAELRPRIWFNPEMESRNYIVPGLIAVIMMVIAALMTSLTIAREWEMGTMEQLISTPLRGHELIIGKLLPYLGIGALDVVLAVGMGVLLFDVPLRGSPVLLVVSAGIFLIGALSMGMLISIVTKAQLLASQIAMVTTFLPAFLLSGFMYDIGNMPVPVQVITHIVPARYFVALLKGIFLKGVGLEVLAGQLAFLTAFTTIVFLLANRKFVKKLR
ncbi:MAG: ABC transporter permease [Thermoanaerobaculia bacterium]